jgi:tRNA A-37 threonylcarbamoyl transferase component Bud32
MWGCCRCVGAETPPPAAAAAAAVCIGGTLGGRYVIERKLGEGGSAVVFRARDTKLRRAVAIKAVLTPPGRERADAVERLRREGTYTAQLRHANIVALYDVHAGAGGGDGLAYLVVELIEGETLQQMVDRRDGRLAVCANVVHIVADVLRALSAVHEAGLVHRDVKPLNIMVTQPLRPMPDGSAPRLAAKLIDFGIAHRIEGAGAGGDSFLTGGISGTGAYMGPLARSGATVPQVDLWAVGVTLFQCVAFELPWPQGLDQIAPLPMELLGGLPRALCAVVAKALSPDYRQGYRAATEFLGALEAAGGKGKSGLTTIKAQMGELLHGQARVLLNQRALLAASLATKSLVGALALDEHDCPRYVYVVPDTPPGGWKKGVFWFHGMHATQVRLVLACAHDFQVVRCGPDGMGYPIKIEKDWVKTFLHSFGPVIRVGLFAARAAVMASGVGIIALPFLPHHNGEEGAAVDGAGLQEALEGQSAHMHQLSAIEHMIEWASEGVEAGEEAVEVEEELDRVLERGAGEGSGEDQEAPASPALKAWMGRSYRSLRALLQRDDPGLARTGLVKVVEGGGVDWVAAYNEQAWREQRRQDAAAQVAAIAGEAAVSQPNVPTGATAGAGAERSEDEAKRPDTGHAAETHAPALPRPPAPPPQRGMSPPKSAGPIEGGALEEALDDAVAGKGMSATRGSRVDYDRQPVRQHAPMLLPPPPRAAQWANADACESCGKPFTMTDRRHHCRQCGRCVCGDCSLGMMGVHGYTGLQRACERCVASARASLAFVEAGGDAVVAEAGRLARKLEGASHANLATPQWAGGEITLRISGPTVDGIYVGLCALSKPVASAETPIHGDRDVWMMSCCDGCLHGHGMWSSDRAGRIPLQAALTLRYDPAKGTLLFVVNGRTHGPGVKGVDGKVKICVEVHKKDTAVRLLL